MAKNKAKIKQMRHDQCVQQIKIYLEKPEHAEFSKMVSN